MATTHDYVHRYTKLEYLIDLLETGHLTLTNPDNWKDGDENDRELMMAHKKRTGKTGLYVFCAAACSETHHHWKIYTERDDGVRVVFNRERLIRSVQRNPNVSCQNMKYVPLKRFEDRDDQELRDKFPFLKRWGFAAEAEFRVILTDGELQKNLKKLHFDRLCVASVVLNPWWPEDKVESAKARIRKAAERPKLRVAKSRLTNSPKWGRLALRLLDPPAAT